MTAEAVLCSPAGLTTAGTLAGLVAGYTVAVAADVLRVSGGRA